MPQINPAASRIYSAENFLPIFLALKLRRSVSGVYRRVNELEVQLDYERVRRETLEAELDEYRAETSHLNLQINDLSAALKQAQGVSFCKITTVSFCYKTKFFWVVCKIRIIIVGLWLKIFG